MISIPEQIAKTTINLARVEKELTLAREAANVASAMALTGERDGQSVSAATAEVSRLEILRDRHRGELAGLRQLERTQARKVVADRVDEIKADTQMTDAAMTKAFARRQAAEAEVLAAEAEIQQLNGTSQHLAFELRKNELALASFDKPKPPPGPDPASDIHASAAAFVG